MFSMNRLSTEKRAQILGMLTEGNSLRATSRMAGVSFNTVSKLLLDIGAACTEYQDRALRDLPCTTVQVDEIWSFCYSKAKNVPAEHKGEFGYGDVWTWTAICADTKLIPSWLVGERTVEDGWALMADLKSRMRNRIQLTTDGHPSHSAAIGLTFGRDIDWAILEKKYATEIEGQRRYSPPVCTGIRVRVRKGNPDPDKISTSYVERANLTMRMGMRRFTRLTNAFSKRVDSHAAAVALHFMHYNFARPHSSLKNPYPRTPAMAAGVADHVWSLTEIAALLDQVGDPGERQRENDALIQREAKRQARRMRPC
jgi:IS1 family transposase/lambda repressor-like predicted transcriptional regulator